MSAKDKNGIIKLSNIKLIELSEQLKMSIEERSDALFKYELRLKTCNEELKKRGLKG